MKKFISILLGTILISLTACSTGSGTEKAKIEIIPEGTELSGTLEIWSDSENTGRTSIEGLRDGFEEIHPEVEIIINDGHNYLDNYGALDDEKFKADLGIKMLSGDAPDLLYNEKDYVTNFVPSGLIYDLYEFIEADDSFNTEDYFEEILRLGEINGSLYSIADGATFDFHRHNIDVLEAADVQPDTLESIDYKFIYDVYNKAMASGEVPYFTHIGIYGKAYGFLQELPVYFNKETLTANFNTAEFIDYLETVNAYTAQDTMPIGNFDSYNNSDYSIPIPEDYPYIGMSVSTHLPYGPEGVLREDESLTKPIPLLNSSGEYQINPGNAMSIPSNAENPQLAWEFIKYCISEVENMDTSLLSIGKVNGTKYSGYMPVNKNNAETYINASLVGYSDEQKEEFMSYIDKALDLQIAGAEPPHELLAAVVEILEDYLNDLMTAEECAKAMQDRAEIYFAEIG